MSLATYLRGAVLAATLSPYLLFGQDLFTALGGVHAPQIRVTTEGGEEDLQATHQGFIRRAKSGWGVGAGDVYGFGYTSIHFTFASYRRLERLAEKLNLRVIIRFYDINDVEIYRQNITRDNIYFRCPQPSPSSSCAYEINLKDFILARINDVRRIDIDIN